MSNKINTEGASNFASRLFHSSVQAHIFHLQAEGNGSFAAHKALNEYYDGIVDLLDGFIESYQGSYGIIKGYKLENFQDSPGGDAVVSYFEDLLKYIEIETPLIFSDSDLINIIDEIKTLIRSTLYKLKYLK